MKNKILFVFLFSCLLFSCSNKEKKVQSEENTDIMPIFQLKTSENSVNFELLEKNRKLYVNLENVLSDSGYVMNILVFDDAEMKNQIQAIQKNIDMDFVAYSTDDFNFDGYDDFSFIANRGNVNNYSVFYFWNEKTSLFEECKELSTVSSPSFNKTKKQVFSWSRDSAISGVKSLYRYIDGKLTCVASAEYCYPTVDGDKNIQKLIFKEYSKNKLKTVIDIDVPLELVTGERDALESEKDIKKSFDEFLKKEASISD